MLTLVMLLILALAGLPFTIGYIYKNRQKKGAFLGPLLIQLTAFILPFIMGQYYT